MSRISLQIVIFLFKSVLLHYIQINFQYVQCEYYIHSVEHCNCIMNLPPLIHCSAYPPTFTVFSLKSFIFINFVKNMYKVNSFITIMYNTQLMKNVLQKKFFNVDECSLMYGQFIAMHIWFELLHFLKCRTTLMLDLFSISQTSHKAQKPWSFKFAIFNYPIRWSRNS